MPLLGSFPSGRTSLLCGADSVPTAAGICAPAPGLFITDGASFATGTEGVLTASSAPACVSCSCATRLHPVIAGTVALWQLQTDLKDSSGHGLDAVSVNGSTNLPTPAPAFVPLGVRANGVFTPDDCLVGLPMQGDTDVKLLAPLTPLLQLTGPMTIQWLMMQQFTFTTAYFACENPAVHRGGVDRIGSLYSVWSDSGNPAVTDEFMGSNIPSSTYYKFPGYSDHSLHNWADVGNPAPNDYSWHDFAVVRDNAGNWQAYRDGVTAGAGIVGVGTNVAGGLEQLFIGGFQSSSGGGGVFASIRILNYARPAAAILADAIATQPCPEAAA